MAQGDTNGDAAGASRDSGQGQAWAGQGADRADDTGALELEPAERELLAEEAAAFRDGLKDPQARVRYAALLAGVQDGRVAEPLLPLLEGLLELGLESGRLRRRYTAEGEQALLRVFQRTPRGRAMRATVAETNRALEARGPGAYRLALRTDRGSLTLGVGRRGVTVESLEVEA
jgi:hypothetical protein